MKENYSFISKRELKQSLLVSIFSLLIFCVTAPFSSSRAQLPGEGYLNCLGQPSCIDPTNSGINSNDPASLSYDNVMSVWHSSAAQWVDGGIKIWGQHTQANGSSSFLVPTSINPGNGFNYSGDPVMLAMASIWDHPQFVLMTSEDELWAWGYQGVLVSSSLTSGSTNSFQKLSIGLPNGVTAFDVKMLFGTVQTLALTTCSGDVYVLSQNDQINQGGSSTSWVRVKTGAGNNSYLTNVIATRGTSAGLIALDANGDLWTWGYGTRLGDNSGSSNRTYATKMDRPKSGTIKMIGAMKHAQDFNSYGVSYATSSNISYYVLYQDGALYALGGNADGQLGNFSNGNINSNTWIQPRYSNNSNDVMNDIAWISPQEHSYNEYPSINVISRNNNGEIWNWGQESGFDLGRNEHGSTQGGTKVNPGQPTDFSTGNNSDIITVESGSHTTMLLRKCDNTFGYIGHKVDGSMGDNNPADETVNKVQFASNVIDVCGLPTTNGTLKPSIEGNNNTFFNNTPIQLVGSPVGGGYAIAEVDGQPYNSNPQGITIDTETGLLDATNATFGSDGSHTLRVTYTIPAGEECEGATVQLVLIIQEGVDHNITIPGNVWLDNNEDAVTGSDEVNYEHSNLWANLTNPDGVIIARAKVNADGTYDIIATSTSLTQSGDYKIILTDGPKALGNNLTESDEPGDDLHYTGTNRGDASSANTNNADGVFNIGDLSSYSTAQQDESTDPVNFGVNIKNTTNAVNDENSTWINTPVNGDVTTNDFDPQGDTQTFGSFLNQDGSGDPINSGATVSGTDSEGNPVTDAGTMEFNSDGTYTYTPATDFVGNISVPYNICDDGHPQACASAVLDMTVSPQPADANSVIANNDEYTSVGGASVQGNVTDNDMDPQKDDSFKVVGFGQGNTTTNPGSSITVSGVDKEGNPVANAGTLIQNEDGTFTFDPANGFEGTVTYQYEIEDDHYDDNPDRDNATDMATVVITVNKGTAPGANPKNNPPHAGDDFIIVEQGETGNGNYVNNDADPDDDPLSMKDDNDNPITITPNNGNPQEIKSVETVEGGSVTFYDDGTYTYTPPASSFEGSDRVVYEVCDVTDVAPQPLCSKATIHILVPSTGRVLPIKLTAFNAVKDGNSVKVTWTTATEQNNAGFDVDRSTDGRNWQSIGHVNSKAANGTSSSELNYSFMDNNPADGVNYYRLTQTDLDGNSSVSDIRTVSFASSGNVTIYPNPVRTTAVVKGLSGNETLRVYDDNGRVVKEERASSTQTTINFTGVAQGTYRVQVIAADGRLVKTLSVIKAR